MAVHRLAEVIQNLGRRPIPDDPNDDELLGRFIEHRDESAFAALVRRHGPMVWGVCRRLVGHHQDAEDAFQATFLVLARKATAVRPRRMVANWLYGVANRTALKAKVMAGKRHAREKQMPHLPETGAGQQESWGGLDQRIDRELAALPDKYRSAVVLCDLEGNKGKDVARLLKIPEGTLASRLRTGRVMLAKRLTRHGITLSGGALATVLSGHAVRAGVPAGLVSSTIQAATRTAGRALAVGVVSANVAALMEGVMKAMVLTKLKPVTAVVLVAGLLALGGAGTRHAVGGQQVRGPEEKGETPTSRHPSPGARDAANPNAATADARDAAAKKEASRADKGKATVSYPVADLVVPIPDADLNAPKNEAAKTKEDWLIRKITRAVSPASWEGSGGTGTIQYSPLDKTLVVSNTARVQVQVRYLLETMRRVQDVQVSAEIRILSLDAACFLKLQRLLPQLEKGDHAVLNDAEAFALLRKAQDETGTKVGQGPKLTLFPGQRVSLSLDPGKELSEARKTGVKLGALVAADLQHLQLEVEATVGKAGFSNTTRMEDGATLVQFKRNGSGYLMLIVTPRVIISPAEEEAATGAGLPRAADKE